MKKISVLLGMLAVSVGLLQGCSSMVSKGISDDGKQVNQVLFPELNKAWRHNGAYGTFPDLADLRKVVPGVTKQQLPDTVNPVAGNRLFKITQTQKMRYNPVS